MILFKDKIICIHGQYRMQMLSFDRPASYDRYAAHMFPPMRSVIQLNEISAYNRKNLR